MELSFLAEEIILLICCIISVTLGEFNLTILHTNDVHARFDEMSKYGGHCRPSDAAKGECYGGIARRMTALRHVRNTTDHVLFLDAGDQFQGTLWFFIHQGNAAAHFMNLLKYDAMSLGNHEFDNGIPGLRPFLNNAQFPILACNIDASRELDVAKVLRKSHVFSFGQTRVGVIGFITTETPSLSFAGNLVFLDVVKSIQLEVSSLRSSGVDILIALGHSGYSDDILIAQEVDGIDIVIGGHTNTFLYSGTPPSNEVPEGTYPTLIQQHSGRTVLVVQNYAFGKYLGNLKVSFDSQGELLRWDGNPWLLDNSVEQAADVLVDMETWRSDVDDMYQKVVGFSGVFVDGSKEQCRLRECTMGNMLTDAELYRHLVKKGDTKPADAAILNSGSIRASLEEGNLTLGELSGVQPFRNTVDVIEIRGKHLREILEYSVMGYDVTVKHGKFLQVAGLRVLYDLSRPDGQKVAGLCVRSQRNHVTYYEPIAADHVYRVVVPSFIIRGGDGYTMVKQNALKHELFEALDVDVTREYITHHNPVYPTLEGRITFTSGNATEHFWGCDVTPMALGKASMTSLQYCVIICVTFLWLIDSIL